MTRPRRLPEFNTALVALCVVAGLYFARAVLIPLAFAITLSLVLSPVVGWLQTLHVRRFLAVLGVMLVALAITGAIGYVILNQLLQVVNDLPGYRENIDNKIRTLRTPNTGSLGQAAQNFKELRNELATAQELPPPASVTGESRRINTPANPLPVQVIEPPVSGMDYVRDLARPFVEPLGIIAIVLVFTVFLLVEETDIRNRFFSSCGVESAQH